MAVPWQLSRLQRWHCTESDSLEEILKALLASDVLNTWLLAAQAWAEVKPLGKEVTVRMVTVNISTTEKITNSGTN